MSSASTTRSCLEGSLPAFTVSQADDGIWRVAVQIAPTDQVQLDAATSTPRDLCCQTQHALAHAQYGSRIFPEQSAVGVYLSDAAGVLDGPSVRLDGPAALWFVCHASPADLRMFLQAIKRQVSARVARERLDAA